jgi:hypothetical protein
MNLFIAVFLCGGRFIQALQGSLVAASRGKNGTADSETMYEAS